MIFDLGIPYKAKNGSCLASKSERPSSTKSNNFIELVAPDMSPEPLPKLSITTPDGLKLELDYAWTPQDTVSFLRSWSQR